MEEEKVAHDQGESARYGKTWGKFENLLHEGSA